MENLKFDVWSFPGAWSLGLEALIIRRLLLGACLLGVSFATSQAQDVLAPPPADFSGLPSNYQTTGTNQPGALPPITLQTGANEAPLQLGPVDLRPHLLYRFLYGDGIPAAPGHHLTTSINELYPGILLSLGSHWHLDYTPTLRFYSNKAFKDTFDNSVILTAGGAYRDWTVGFSQSYVSSSQPLIETGGQTDQETYTTLLNATWQISTPLSLELGVNQTFRFVGPAPGPQALSDSATWSTMDWLNYQFSPKFAAALGLGFAYDYLKIGPDMTSEQLQGRITWRPGEKFYLILSGGAEDRQFLDSGAADALNPVFGATIQYHLFEPTTLSLGANHVISSTYLAGQYSQATSVTAGLHQRLLGHFYLDATGGFTRTSYKDTVLGLPANRTDDGTFVTVRLSAQILTRGTAGVFYQFTDNSSTQSTFTFTSNQVGFDLGYRF